MGKAVGEIVKMLRDSNTRKERKEILLKHKNLGLQTLFRLQFDPKYKIGIEKGVPDHKVSEFGYHNAPVELNSQYKRFYSLLDTYDRVNPERKKLIFIGMLENLPKYEANILLDVKDKKFSCGVTKKLLEEVYPGLISSVGDEK